MIDLNDGILSITENKEEGEAELQKAVNKLKEKGFDYVEAESDYMIFRENETGYYGVLWSVNPRKAIKNIVKDSRPYMKSLKLAEERYEVGALGSI